MRFVGVDPATKTGVVILDIDGKVLLETELKGKGKAVKGGISIEQLVDLENQLYTLLEPGDEIVIEQPAMGTQRGVTTGMIHGGLRSMVHRRSLTFNDINPMHTKRYVDNTGWTVENGKKRRYTATEKKKAVLAAVNERFGYTHKSDNVVDAYIIARAAVNLYRMREWMPLLDSSPNQKEVTEAILNKAL